MPKIKRFYNAFVGGEVTPEFAGRVTDEKYLTGATKMRNFIALPHGPARLRPGFEFVAEVKDSSVAVRLLRFTFSTTQTLAIELGPGYFRFHTDGATIVDDDGNPYEVANDYAEEDLFEIKYVQSNDILTLVHPDYPPMELRRYGTLDWTFTQIDFSEKIEAPTITSVTATYDDTSGNTYNYTYGVTAVTEDGDESEISETVTVTGNLYSSGGENVITWTAVDGAYKYKVYKKSSGVMGYIGTTQELTFTDDLITADTSSVPPEYDITFDTVDDYPGAVTYFEQRRCFARSNNSPQTLWMTKSGTESNMSIPVVVDDDDAIEVKIATRDANTILHLVPLSTLVVMTSSAELLCTSSTGASITSTNIMVKPQAYVGSSDVTPEIVNNIMLYVAARGNHVREMGYSDNAGGYVTGDLTLRSPHLFDGKKAVDMAFSASPYPIAWVIQDSGEITAMTYIPEESIAGWHVQETDGSFKSCCVVTENNDDKLYVIVEREINGQTKKYIERMADMLFDDLEDCFFVDSGLSGEFSEPVTVISGLDHLEGKTVAILGDGCVHNQQTVVNGTVTLENEVSKVTIGLPYTGTLQTLPIMIESDQGGYGTMRVKNINKCSIYVYRSSGIWAGFDEDNLAEYKQRTEEWTGFAPELVSKEIDIVCSGQWNTLGQLTIVQDDPLPVTIVYITVEASVGG